MTGLGMILKNFLQRRKKNELYRFKFIKESDGKWYYDFPQWPFAHHNLMMVAGADKLCSFLSEDGKKTDIIAVTDTTYTVHENFRVTLYKTSSSLTKGAFYNVIFPNNPIGKQYQYELWLCPVTLFVLGRYPEYILIY